MTTLAVTPLTQAAQLAIAKAGDTLVYTGAFGDLALTGRNALLFDMRAASFTSILLNSCARLGFVGGAVEGNTTPNASFYGRACQDITVSGINVYGDRIRNGIGFRECARVTVNDCLIDHTNIGITLTDVDGANVRGNQALGAGKDGLDGASLRNAVIEENTFAGFRPGSGVHPDAIQFWMAVGCAPCSNIIVRDNTIRGPCQGVIDGNDAPGVSGLVIEDNDIWTSYPDGINLGTSAGAIVRNNHLRTLAGAKFRTSCHLTAPGIVHCGNVAEAGAGKPEWNDGPCTN